MSSKKFNSRHFLKLLDRKLKETVHEVRVPLDVVRLLTRAILYVTLWFACLKLFSSFNAADLNISDELVNSSPTIEIFSAPPSLTPDSLPQVRNAVLSWRRLRPKPRITLLGRGRGLSRFAQRQKVNHDPLVDHNFLGRPLFNSLILRANRSKADVTVFINSDIILLQDFVSSIELLSNNFPHFMAVGARYDADHIPAHVLSDPDLLREYVLADGALHNYGGMDFWAWTTSGPRLLKGSIPPFVYARGRYDNWFMHEVITHDARPVVDVSETVVSIHEKHAYNSSVPPQAVGLALAPRRVRQRATSGNAVSTAASNFWSRGKSSNFELFLNIHLSIATGSYRDGLGTTRHAPWKLVACVSDREICLVRRMRPGRCHCEYDVSVGRTQLASPVDALGRPMTFEIRTKDDEASAYDIPVQVTRESARNPHFGLPLTLLDALASLMQNSTIVLSALNYGYRDVMMGWVCHLRRLGIENFLVAALDKDLYRFAIARGVPVYYEDSISKGLDGDALRQEGVYGTSQFEKLTKMKTRVVLRVLKLGFDVVWSDSDIVYFRDPLHMLMQMPGDLVIQSNAPDGAPANGIRRINSGFYLARSGEALVRALERVVDAAVRSNLTEQPCFYDELCGADGRFRTGKDRCLRGDVETVFLDRGLFPNGVTAGMWNLPPGSIQKTFPDAMILHNNWIEGISAKRERMRRHGFDIHDSRDDICHFKRFGKVAV